MSLDNLKTATDIEDDGDFLGGYSPLDSAMYTFKIKLAFITLSKNEAMALNVHLENDSKQQLRQQFWMTSAKGKGCKNFYIGKDKKKKYLPGFNQANALCNLTVSKNIADVATESKDVNLYDPAQKKEVPTTVDMLMELLGQEIQCGVIKQIVDVSRDNGKGVYVPTGKTRTENEIDKMFRHPDGLTVTELKAKATKPLFLKKWADKWTGQVKDKSTKTDIKQGAPGATAAPAKSLFEDE